jgi:DNA-binding MarR family transcriptional regulator
MAVRSSKRSNPSDPEFHRADWPFYWIARVNTLYTQEIERVLKAVDCDVPTYRVLAILQEQGVSSVSDIAVHAVGKLSTTTKIVYRMKAEGLVSTETSKTDGRVTMVSLTDAGRVALGRVKDATHGLFERSFDGLTPAKIERLNESLRIVFRNLNGGDHPILDALASDPS